MNQLQQTFENSDLPNEGSGVSHERNDFDHSYGNMARFETTQKHLNPDARKSVHETLMPSNGVYPAVISNQSVPYADRQNSVRPPIRCDFGRLDISTMVVLGESLAAGVGDFSLSSDRQCQGFANQLAAHFGTDLPTPLFQSPGVPIDSKASTGLPRLGQTTVFEKYPPVPFGNLSIPGLRLEECFQLRPCTPLVSTDNPKQTLVNLILGSSSSVMGPGQKPLSQLESAMTRHPSFVILALGLSDILDPVLAGRCQDIPNAKQMTRRFAELLSTLNRTKCECMVLNVPNPLDMPCFSSVESASRVLKVAPSSLMHLYGLHTNDRLTVAGILEIGAQIHRRQITSLNERFVLRSQVSESITQWVTATNQSLAKLVHESAWAVLFDAHSHFQRLASEGLRIGKTQLNADYLGGLYGLNGHSPGATCHASLANALIESINARYDASIPPIELVNVLSADSVAAFRPAKGSDWSEHELRLMRGKESLRAVHTNVRQPRPKKGIQLDREYNVVYRDPPSIPLKLPLDGKQTLPLNPMASYHSDAMRVIDCQAESARWGACEAEVFDGLAMFGGQLSGRLDFEFDPPVGDVSRFKIRTSSALSAEDGVLSTPDFLRFPLTGSQVEQAGDLLCSGQLNLLTGVVSNLDFFCKFMNSGLSVLQTMNPNSFPQPAIIRFQQRPKPNEGYGTAFARFIQRRDGGLDFLFHGTAFVPMGPGFRFALPIGGPTGNFATVPAEGTQLHPHLHLSTVEGPSNSEARSIVVQGQPWIPINATRELIANSASTSFGDDFTLNHPDFGIAYGRSHLAGRIFLQFGERFGNLAPFAVRMLPPASSVDDRSLSPLQDVFPGKLRTGMTGHDAILRFPSRQYRQNDLYLIDDPFEIAVGAVNVYTGAVIGDFLHRGFLGQALFYALIRVEPRTPQGSFEYRGPASFTRTADGALCYQFNGTMFIPYQEGFLWPVPDLANGVPVGPNSRLDPFFQIDAIEPATNRFVRKEGGARVQLAPTGDQFSYRYSISNRPNDRCEFEYVNHAQQASFQLTKLGYVAFSDCEESEPQTVTFSGFGRWSNDETERHRHVAVQISTSTAPSYVSILIDGGRVSNVNTSVKGETQPLSQIGKTRRD